jgi:hypothetical protein
MQMENKKLPKKDSRNSSLAVAAVQHFVARCAPHPMRHGHRRNAEAQPSQQKHREHQHQPLGKTHVGTDQGHSAGQGKDRLAREFGWSSWKGRRWDQPALAA